MPQVQKANRLLSLLSLFSVLFSLSVPAARASDIVPNDDLEGGASVFVFRGSRKTPQERGSVRSFRSSGPSAAARRATMKTQVAASRKKKADAAKARAAAAAKARARERNARLKRSNTLTTQAEAQLERGENAGAIVNFREALKANPQNRDAKAGLSEALTAVGIDTAGDSNNEAALRYFDEAVTLDPTNSVAYAKAGEINDAKGRNDQAIANYEKALKADAGFTSLYLPLGLAYAEAGKIVEAQAALDMAAAAGFDSSESKLARAVIYSKQDRNKEALDILNAVLKTEPQNAAALYQKAVIYAKTGPSDQYIAALKDAVRADQAFVPAWFDLGVNYYNAGDYAAALDAYQRVVKIEPDNYQAQANLASTYRQLERYQEANAAYKAAEPGNKKNADLYSEWGYCLGKTNEWDKSVERLGTARELSPDATDNNNVGWAYYNAAQSERRGNPNANVTAKLQLGKAYLERSVQQDPKSEAAYLNLGATNNSLGDFKAAAVALDQALSIRKDWVIAMNQLGLAYRGSNDLSRALAQFQRVAELDSDNAFGLLNLGELYHLTGNKKEAKKVQDRLKRLNPMLATRLGDFFDGKAIMNGAKKTIQNNIPVKVPKFPFQ